MKVEYGEFRKNVDVNGGITISNNSVTNEWLVHLRIDGKEILRRYFKPGELVTLPFPVRGELELETISSEVACVMWD